MLNEDYKVDLLKKLPVYHRQIYEYQQIAGAQTPELEALLIAIDFVLDNWFIETASEYGIARQEKIAGITPEAGIDLETRRYILLSKMTEKIPYTDDTLEERLASMCGGEDYYSVMRDYLNYKINVTTKVVDKGAFDEICNALVKMLPCNLILTILNVISEEGNAPAYVGGAVLSTKHYIIKECATKTITAKLTSYIGTGVGYSVSTMIEAK